MTSAASDPFTQLPTEKLTRPQEDELATKIQATKDEDAMTRLVMCNLREAVTYARRISHGRLADDQLISICYAALQKNARRFKPGWQRFFAYSKAGVRGDIKRHWGTLDVVKNKYTITLYAARMEARANAFSGRLVQDKSGNGYATECLSYNDLKCSALTMPEESTDADLQPVFTKDRWEQVRPVIDQACNEREKMIITLAYQSGFNFQEIGKLLGVSRSAIQAAHAGAIRKIRCALGAKEGLLRDEDTGA